MLWWASRSPDRYRRGWAYIIAGMAVPVGVSLWQLVTGHGYLETEGLNRLEGTFSHPNSLGPYLVPFIVLLVGGLGRGANATGRLLRAAAAGGLAVLVALTYSRTAILVTGTALFALPVLQARRFGLRGLVRGLALTSVIAGLIWILAGNLIRERFRQPQRSVAPRSRPRGPELSEDSLYVESF